MKSKHFYCDGILKIWICVLSFYSLSGFSQEIQIDFGLKSNHSSAVRIFYKTTLSPNFDMNKIREFSTIPNKNFTKTIFLPMETVDITVFFYNNEVTEMEFEGIDFIKNGDTLSFSGSDVMNQFSWTDFEDIDADLKKVKLRKTRGGSGYTRLDLNEISYKRFQQFVGQVEYQSDTIDVSLACTLCDFRLKVFYGNSKFDLYSDFSTVYVKSQDGLFKTIRIPIMFEENPDLIRFVIESKSTFDFALEYIVINVANFKKSYSGGNLTRGFRFSESLNLSKSEDAIRIGSLNQNNSKHFFAMKYPISYIQKRFRNLVLFACSIIIFMLINKYFFNKWNFSLLLILLFSLSSYFIL